MPEEKNYDLPRNPHDDVQEIDILILRKLQKHTNVSDIFKGGKKKILIENNISISIPSNVIISRLLSGFSVYF